MGQPDNAMKTYFKAADRTASVLNLFLGEQLFDGQDLTIDDGFCSLRDSRGHLTFRQRDLLWTVNYLGTQFHLGLENQMNINLTLPVRLLQTDSLTCTEDVERIQAKNISQNTRYGREDDGMYRFLATDRVNAVLTLVLYWGREPWHFPTGLRDIQNLKGLSTTLTQAFCDYRLNIIHMRSIPDNMLDGMKSDLKYVVGLIKRDWNREGCRRFILEHRDYFSGIPRSAFDLIDACINLNYISGLIKATAMDNNGEERLDMCKALEDMWLEAENKGKKIGQETGIAIGEKKGIMDTLALLVKDGILSVTDAAARAGVSVDAFRQHMLG